MGAGGRGWVHADERTGERMCECVGARAWMEINAGKCMYDVELCNVYVCLCVYV